MIKMKGLFYDLVPKCPIENLKWRIRCRERALTDEKFRNAFWQAGEDDPLFFMAAFLWVKEPRARIKTRPFIPWVHQEPVVHAMESTIDEALDSGKPVSLTIKKSRAQGGTFLYIAVTVRRVVTQNNFTVGLVTRNETLVDSKVDDSAVLYKVAEMLDGLPAWAIPNGYDRNLTEHVIKLSNGSGWSGYAATGDVARGGRATMFCFDEPGSEEFVAGNKDYKVMSSVGSVANCIILCSTFGTDSGVFYESATDPDNPRVCTLDWKDNPDHSKLSYIYQDGVYKAVRPEEQKQVEEYVASHQRELKTIASRGHKIDGKIRSPWYNAHCLLPGASPRYIARELDMDARGAVGKVFAPELLDRMKQAHGKPPVWRGVPIFDNETLKLTGLLPRDDGPLSLWFKPGIDYSPPLGPFTVACDIASGGTGAYASNSVASGIDHRTGEQVLEYVIKGMEPRSFAKQVIGISLWLRKALLAWEDSGVSSGFAKEVMEVWYYGNVYFREVLQLGSQKKSRKPGFPCREADTADRFERLALAMHSGRYTPRSVEMLMECGEYEWRNGKVVHAPTAKNKGAVDKNHGDRCVAASGAWLVFSSENEGNTVDKGKEPSDNPEYGSFLWRERQEIPLKTSGSPGFSLRDLLGN
jgi:hypothetical protein